MIGQIGAPLYGDVPADLTWRVGQDQTTKNVYGHLFAQDRESINPQGDCQVVTRPYVQEDTKHTEDASEQAL
jgi:hypothetical protein